MEWHYLTNTDNTLNCVVEGNNVGLQPRPFKPGIYEWNLAGCPFRLHDWWKATLPHRLNGNRPRGDPVDLQQETAHSGQDPPELPDWGCQIFNNTHALKCKTRSA